MTYSQDEFDLFTDRIIKLTAIGRLFALAYLWGYVEDREEINEAVDYAERITS